MIWFGNVLHGDLGQSITSSQPVLPLVAGPVLDQREDRPRRRPDRQRWSAVPAGLIAAWRQNSVLDLGLVGTATVLLSIPTFWLGLLLLLFFGLKLEWLPVVGYVSFSRGSDGGFALHHHARHDPVPA